MKISSKGLKLIKKFEGCKLKAYKDVAGVWTIGYGHTGGVTSGQSITQAQANEFLTNDCKKAEAAVNKYVSKYKFNQNQFDALTSFAFNIGNINQLTANGTRTIAQISAKIPAYCNSGGKKEPGLVTRRAEEKKLFDTPVSGQTSSPSTSTSKKYAVGKTYTLQSNMKVRTGAGTNYKAKTYKELTAGGKKADANKDGALDKGTKVTCQEVKKVGNDTWIRIPSGWIAAIYKGKVYVK